MYWYIIGGMLVVSFGLDQYEHIWVSSMNMTYDKVLPGPIPPRLAVMWGLIVAAVIAVLIYPFILAWLAFNYARKRYL